MTLSMPGMITLDLNTRFAFPSADHVSALGKLIAAAHSLDFEMFSNTVCRLHVAFQPSLECFRVWAVVLVEVSFHEHECDIQCKICGQLCPTLLEQRRSHRSGDVINNHLPD